MNADDIPLTDVFFDNPLQFFQNYVRNLNNELFLSQYHINNLYVLLLIGRNSPWDNLRGNNDRMKEEIDLVVNFKVQEVKTILATLSNLYEDKAKKSAITQIQKLMAILKSKKKSIYIEKDKAAINLRNFQLLNHISQMDTNNKPKQEQFQETPKKEGLEQVQTEEKMVDQQQNSNEKLQVSQQQQLMLPHNEKPAFRQQRQHQDECKRCPEHSKIEQNMINNEEQEHSKKSQEQSARPKANNEVFSIFYGLSNLSNLSALALTNVIEYNSAQRYIKFKMSENYNMTIKNQDPVHFDKFSSLSRVPPQLFTNHIFPYLTASQLFKVRSVCKEWLQNVKQSWHATFKRQMFVQLLACEFCKDIEFFYKLIQLRNPFFQKFSLLIHALIEIIQWDNVYESIRTNNLTIQLKRIMIIILRLIGEPIDLPPLNAINDEFFEQHKPRLLNLKEKVTQFFSTLSGSDLTINDLRKIKINYLDDPFMRVQQVNAQDKSPLLLTLFAKQMTLQQILRNHIFLCQQYLLNTKKRLDNISKKMVYQKGYLEGVYKVLLLKSSGQTFADSKQQSQMPNFHQMLQSIFTNRNSDKPDFVIKAKNQSTQIFLDNATKLDLILTTVYNLQENMGTCLPRREERQEGSHSSFLENQNEKIEEEHDKQKRQSKNQITTAIDLKIQCKPEIEDQFEEERDLNRENK